MFDRVKDSFYEEKSSKIEKQSNYDAVSGNGSLKLFSSGNPFVDDFMRIASYREPRSIKEVFETMNNLWEVDPIMTLKESVYIRMITRDSKLLESSKKVKSIGQGLKAEFFNRLLWLAAYHLKTFHKNIPIFIAAGSWDDIFEIMRIDLSYEHDGDKYKRVLDWSFLGNLIAVGLKDPEQSELIKKFMPQIKAAKYCTTKRSQCNNYIGKWLAKRLFGKENKVDSYRKYHALKASGTAHEWQQLISQGRFKEIDFNKIPGRALSILANSKFLVNHNLEGEFAKWLSESKDVKFNGFVYELFKTTTKSYESELINKQFNTLISQAKEMQTENKFICCLDISGSMSSPCIGLPTTSSIKVAASIALYLSHLMDSPVNGYLRFSRTTDFKTWKGDTPYEQFTNMELQGYGNTNFLSVVDWFISLKSGLNLSEDVVPNGLICISDGEFDSYSEQFDSNFKEFKRRLSEVYSEEFVNNFKIVLWDIPNTFYGYTNRVPKFESLADEPNFFYMSGFDPAGITFLTGKTPEAKEYQAPKTAEELFYNAMNQELLSMLRI